MSKKIIISNEYEFQTLLSDLDFWWPHITKILIQHNLPGVGNKTLAKCGDNPTYPVFLINDIVIKFYGYLQNWQNAFNVESLSHESLIKDKTILAPKILAKGQLFIDSEASWLYIVFPRIVGQAWLDSDLTFEEKNTVAAEIGEQLSKIHMLPIDKRLQQDHTWSKLDLTIAARKSILPRHLVEQVKDYVDKLGDFDRCFVNGDIVTTHVFVENGHLSGIIDWGDATVTDRHYELGKLMDTFDWDKKLLKTMLEASNWPIRKNFTQQALGLALFRQAVGLTQHRSFDVFYKLPDIYALESITTLGVLADILFGV